MNNIPSGEYTKVTQEGLNILLLTLSLRIGGCPKREMRNPFGIGGVSKEKVLKIIRLTALGILLYTIRGNKRRGRK